MAPNLSLFDTVLERTVVLQGGAAAGRALQVDGPAHFGVDFDLQSIVGVLSQSIHAMNVRVIPTVSQAHAIVSRVAASDAALTNNLALDAISDNEFDTVVAIRGVSRGRGILKLSHLGCPSGDPATNAAVISIDVQGDNNQAQGIFMRRTGTNPTGAFIAIRNDANTFDAFHVHGDTLVGIGTGGGAQPLGRLEVKQRSTSEKLAVLTAIAAATGALLEITSDSGTLQILPNLTLVGPNAPSGIPGQQGMAGWTYDPVAATSSTVLANAGSVLLSKIVPTQSATITKILYYLSGSAPTGLSNCFVGLYDASGTRLGLSADLSSDWVGAAGKKISTIGSVAVTGGTPYYVAFLYGAATAHPTLARSTSSSIFNINLAVGAQRSMRSGSGLTALPSSITMGGNTEDPNAYWFGLAV